jgi:hypothetical protein
MTLKSFSAWGRKLFFFSQFEGWTVGDRDDWAIARDTAVYLGADAAVYPPPPNVVLEADGKKLVIPAETWGRVWWATYKDCHKTFDGQASAACLVWLAAGAKSIGLADWAGKLEQFRAGMEGMAAVKREDGSLWTPTPVRTVSPKNNSTTKPITVRPPTPQDYAAKKMKAYTDADREALQEDVRAHFAKIEDMTNE